MACFSTVMLALQLLILTANQGFNGEVAAQNTTENGREKCVVHRHQYKINELVQDYSRNGSWITLRRDLSTVLEHNSDTYSQLHRVFRGNESFTYKIGRHGYNQLALLLLCAGLPIDLDDDDGDTMLHGAAVDGHLKMMRLLLNRGADINKKGRTGRTPLFRAAQYGQLEAVKMLVQAGADTTIRSDADNSPLDKARENNITEVVEYLEFSPN